MGPEKVMKTTSGKNEQTEVTLKMIDAGVDILMEFEWGWSNPRATVKAIYCKMISVASEGAKLASQRPHSSVEVL